MKGTRTVSLESGYWIEPELFSAAECEDVLRSLYAKPLAKGRAGRRHLMSNDAVAAVARDPRLLAIAQKAVGSHAIPFRATLFDKSREANWLVAWHQDTALPLTARFDVQGWGPWSEKGGILYANAPASVLSRVLAIRVHLDASTPDNGPLRVVPGSHVQGVLTGLQIFDYVRNHEPVACLASRGGVLAMRPLIIHASSKAQSEAARRVLHIEYAESIDIAPDGRLAIA